MYTSHLLCSGSFFLFNPPGQSNASATGASGDANAVQQGETLAAVGTWNVARGMIGMVIHQPNVVQTRP